MKYLYTSSFVLQPVSILWFFFIQFVLLTIPQNKSKNFELIQSLHNQRTRLQPIQKPLRQKPDKPDGNANHAYPQKLFTPSSNTSKIAEASYGLRLFMGLY